MERSSLASKQVVAGSSPAGPTKRLRRLDLTSPARIRMAAFEPLPCENSTNNLSANGST